MRGVLPIVCLLALAAPASAPAALRVTEDQRAYFFPDEDGAADVVTVSVGAEATVVTDSARISRAGPAWRWPRRPSAARGRRTSWCRSARATTASRSASTGAA